MASPDSNTGFLFSGLRQGRDGVQCERSVRAISYIFHGWAHYTGSRPLIHGQPDNSVLRIIPFEKLALLWTRLWTQLWRINGAKEPIKGLQPRPQKTDKQINFPQPFTIERAKHGKRPQRYDGVDRPTTLAEIVYGLQELGLRYFDVHPYMEAGRADPNDYRTEVHATLPPETRSQLLTVFNEAERQVIDELDSIVRPLGVSEIRALGTHETLEETMRDIELEFVEVYVLAPGIISKLANGEPFQDVARDIQEYAKEAFLKSSAEREQNYQSAYARFIDEIKNPFLAESFKRCQQTAAAIWASSGMFRCFFIGPDKGPSHPSGKRCRS